MDELRLRQATIDDLSFLVTASRAAERLPNGDGDGIYERVYGLTNEEVDRFFSETLAQDTKDNQLTFKTFNVIVLGAQPVACCSAWVEAQSGQPSGLKVAMAVSRFLGAGRWRDRSASSTTLAKCAPRRTSGALQLETFYVVPDCRGKGLAGRLIEGVVERFSCAGRAPSLAEISLLRENKAAAAAYTKAGFEPGLSPATTDEQFFALTGSRGFLQMRRVLP